MGLRIVFALSLAVAMASCEHGAADAPTNGVRPAESALSDSGAHPERFGIGQPATAEAIARLDIDVMPDGRGLPPGSGTPEQGAALYATGCASCHGADGEGTTAGSALVGRNEDDAFDFARSMEAERRKTIGNYWPYATTLFDYIRRSMPFDRPGSLSNDEVYALTAYLLHRNGIIEREAAMDATTLAAVRMPARDYFEPDDRLTSTKIR